MRLKVLLERGEAGLRSLVRSLSVLVVDFFSGDDEALRNGNGRSLSLLPVGLLAAVVPEPVLLAVSVVAVVFFAAAAAVLDEEDLVKSFGKTIELKGLSDNPTVGPFSPNSHYSVKV